MEDRLIIVDGINNNIEEAKDFQDFVDYVKEGIDPDEGFDMDITSIALFKRVGHVKIGDETGHFKPNKYGEQIPIRQVEYVNELSHPSDSDIERYDFDHKGNFTQHHDGQWVKYEDYQRMRDRMNGEIAYWKEVALNPDCICERTTEIDKCPVHSTGPEK